MTRILLGLHALLIAAIFATPALAERGGESAWYGELRGGTVFAQDSDLDIPGFDASISSETGWMVEGATGFAHGSGLRGELALGYRSNDLDKFKLSGFGSADINGDIWAVTTMVNGYYDLHLDRMGLDGMFWSRFTPFVGGGVGAAFVEVDVDGVGDGDDISFAYQGLGGFSYAFSSQWNGTLSYSYLSTVDSSFDGIDFDYESHNVTAGIRFRFY